MATNRQIEAAIPFLMEFGEKIDCGEYEDEGEVARAAIVLVGKIIDAAEGERNNKIDI